MAGVATKSDSKEARVEVPNYLSAKLKKYQARVLISENREIRTIPDTIVECLDRFLKDIE